MISRFLTPLKSLLYRPDRVQRNFRKFDVDRGFGDYHEQCKAQFTRNVGTPQASPLATSGFEHFDILDPAAAGELLKNLIDQHGVRSVKKDTPALTGFEGINGQIRRDILKAVLTPSVDRRIVEFFSSEYLVLWMIVSVTQASAADEIVSFKWHCDRGPSQHLKLLVYLNASTEHGGNTEFIPLADSQRVAQKGYIFGRAHKRTNDVGLLSRIAGKSIETVLQPIPSGSGVLFQPARVLHRGVAPDRGTRYAVTLCLLPSQVPWEEALDNGSLRDIGSDNLWPSHASRLIAVAV